MKKIIGIVVVVLLIPFFIFVISDIDRVPIYPTTEFNIEKLTRISSLDIENNDIELVKLPNGVSDKWYPNGVERKVGRTVLNGSEIGYNASKADYMTNTAVFYIPQSNASIYNTNCTMLDTKTALSNIFSQGSIYYVDTERFMIRENGYLYFRILKTRLVGWDDNLTSLQQLALFTEWLSQNNFEILYQLATPTFDYTKVLPDFIDFYDGGSVIVDDGIVDYTVVENQAKINYIEGNITTVVDNQFKISKPTKIISKSNDLYDYDLSNLPSYLEYGILPAGTYDNTLEFINNNQNKEIKIFFDDIIRENRYNTYIENDTIIINNDTEFIKIYNNDTYTSTRNLDIDITYKLEGYNIIDYIDGKFNNNILSFFWVIPIFLVGGLLYLLIGKRKE